ncbi:DNA methyltransferase [Lachnospiraceae bacterium 54-53]
MSFSNELDKLYSISLPSTRSGVFFNTFAYPTKISPEIIAIYIAVHTKPRETVLDVFGGSGSTGIAAMMCEHPTEQMLKISKDLDIKPVWGPRNAIIYELGKYGSFASDTVCNPPESKEFTKIAKEFIKEAKKDLGWIYKAKDPSGMDATLRHIIWSDVIKCPECGHEFSYYEAAVEYNPMKIRKNCNCPQCSVNKKIEEYEHCLETKYDKLLEKEVTTRKRIPVRIYGQTGTQKWSRLVNNDDLERIEHVESMSYFEHDFPKAVVWGDLYRAGYHTGITHLHHFYTRRNYYVMSYLWEKASQYNGRIRDALRLLLLSYNASHSTLMTRVVVKKKSKDFVLTGAQNGVLYISSLPVEKNILVGIERKIKIFERAYKYINDCNGNVEILNASSEVLDIDNDSIKYVFTDPPFGDYIPYAEINQINELWLGETTDRCREIIVSPAQNKKVDDYGEMLKTVFKEISRVLRRDGLATIVFHSSKADVWHELRASFENANLLVKNTSILDKTQSSFKQVVSDISVQGDPVILLGKGEGVHEDTPSIEILDETIKKALSEGNKDVRNIYSRYLTSCLDRGVAIMLGAKEAYEYVRERVEVNIYEC